MKIVGGLHAGDSGSVIDASSGSGTVTLFSDLTNELLEAFAQDLVLSAETGTGLDSRGQFELFDLVQLESAAFTRVRVLQSY